MEFHLRLGGLRRHLGRHKPTQAHAYYVPEDYVTERGAYMC